MVFIIKYNNDYSGEISENSEAHENPGSYISFLPSSRKFQLIRFSSVQFNYYILGDFIPDKIAELKEIIEKTEDKSKFKFPYGIRGMYYLIRSDHGTGECIVSNSLFGILPVYIYNFSGYTYISSSLPEIISRAGNNLTIDARFFVERTLFNYALFNSTWFEEITTLPSNSFIRLIKNKTEVAKHTEIKNLFITNPVSCDRAANEMADMFIGTASRYMPSEKFLSSFTSGFDSRVLVAIAKKEGKNFSAFSYGTENSIDLKLPKEQCAVLGIPFTPFILSGEYIDRYYFEAAKKIILYSDGCASFSRAHYFHAARIISQDTKFIITGNFGSELLRSMHSTGALISPAMLKIIGSRHNNNWEEEIFNDKRMRWIEPSILHKVRDSIIQDIKENLLSEKNQLPPNQLLYAFTWEEIFRKYFGPEINMQSHFIMNRTPFIDFDFFKAIQNTRFSGAYSRFLEHNPMYRFKGQLLYAHILKKTNPELYRMMTGKGYRPRDLISAIGKLRLVHAHAAKKIGRASYDSDPLCATRAFKCYREEFSKWINNSFIVNRKNLSEDMHDDESENYGLKIVLSNLYYLSEIMKRG
ncbi:MAG: hypothetical protein V1904_11065 [Bacteroidota bacterium]